MTIFRLLSRISDKQKNNNKGLYSMVHSLYKRPSFFVTQLRFPSYKWLWLVLVV